MAVDGSGRLLPAGLRSAAASRRADASTRCSTAGATSSCAATWISTPSISASAVFAVPGPRERVPLAVDAGPCRGVLRGPALDPAAEPVHDPRLPGRPAALLLLRRHPDYGWDRVCEQRFGTHPVPGLLRLEHRRPRAGHEAAPSNARSPGRNCRASSTAPTTRSNSIEASGKKGWLPAYRDAVMFKVAYSYGLRFNELRHLQTVDFATNPHAREFGKLRCLQGPVRQVPQGFTAQTPQRPDGLRLDRRRPRGLARQRPRNPSHASTSSPANAAD